MTEKRFTIRSYNGIGCHIFDGSIVIAEVHRADIKKLCDLLNALHEENQALKQVNEDAIHILKEEFDFATEQRQKHLDDPVVANAYDIIRYDMRRALDKLGDYE
jgi:hypothetical protein